MKIKEVCLRTGLTDRTIRFYIEKGLLNVDASDVNGRNYREYSEEDVEILNDISKLRKAKFSVQDIIDMQNVDGSFEEIVSNHCNHLEQEQHVNEIIVQRLKKIEGCKNISWRQLSNILISDEEIQTEEFGFAAYEEPVIIEYSRNLKDYLKIAIVTLAVCIALFASTIFAIRHWYEQRTLLAVFTISEGQVHDKWMEGGEQFASISTNPDGAVGYDSYFFEQKVLRIKNIDYYNAIMAGNDSYQSITIRIEIPYKEAKRLELLSSEETIQIETVLSDEDYIKSYCVIGSVMQDDKYYN